jgi:hypothetical protein
MPTFRENDKDWQSARADEYHRLVTEWSQLEPQSRPTLKYYTSRQLKVWDANNPRP